MLLSSATTLRLGGPARAWIEAGSEEALVGAIADLDARGEPLLLVGGGSNLVVGDEGFDGTVIRIAVRGTRLVAGPNEVHCDIAAGEPWDDFVAWSVEAGLAGVECLSGIPGLVGATPMQNVGAYGQEVKDTVVAVRVWDREQREILELARADCQFSYRHSMLKETPRYVVLRVVFALRPSQTSAPIRYTELARSLGVAEGEPAPLRAVREAVLALRRSKGMVLDAADPDSVSAGSFFTNPTMDVAEADALAERARAHLGAGVDMPRFPGDDGRVKVPAAWLIERAGFTRGHGAGRAGISSKHALALVNRGDATTRELLDLARTIRDGVEHRFGVRLAPEPVLVGCSL